MFVNDLYAELSQQSDADNISTNGIEIQNIYLMLLLFADDMVLFSTNAEELQLLLNTLHKYSTVWGLKVNTAKTKLCVFQARRSDKGVSWSYNGENFRS